MDDGEIQHLGTDASLYDLTAVARGFGVDAVSSSTLEELELQLAAALRSDRPTVDRVRAGELMEA